MSTLQEEVPTNTSEDFGFKSLGQKNILPSSEEKLPFASLEHFSILNGKLLYIAYSNDRLIIGDLQVLREFVQNKEELNRDELEKLFEETIPDVIFCGFNANAKAIIVTKSGSLITIDSTSFEKSQESIELNRTILTAKLFHNLLWILDNTNHLFYFDPINNKTSENIQDNVNSFDLYEDKLYLLLNSETENIQILKGERSPELVKSFSNPEEINNIINDDGLKPINISVVSKKRFLIVYGNDVSPEEEDVSYDQKMYIAELNNDETSLIFHESFDIDPPFGSVLRYPHFYNVVFKNLIPDYEYISVLGSSCASELTIYDSKEVVQPSQDSERAVLPISQITDNDTNPTGLALDISTNGKIFDVCLGVDEVEKLPLLYILNNEGDLQIVGLFYSTAIKEGKFNMSSLEDDLHKNNRIAPLVSKDSSVTNTSDKQPTQVKKDIKEDYGGKDSQNKTTFVERYVPTSENSLALKNDSSTLVSPFASLSNKATSEDKTAEAVATAFNSNKPFSFGKTSTPQSSLGQTSFGQTSFGQTSFGQTSFGQKPDIETHETSSYAFGKPAFENLTSSKLPDNKISEQSKQEEPPLTSNLNATNENKSKTNMFGFNSTSSEVKKTEQNSNLFGKQSFGAPSFGAPSFGAPSFGAPSFGASASNTEDKSTESAFGKLSFGTPSFEQSSNPVASINNTGSVFGSIGKQDSPFANLGKQDSPFANLGKQDSPFANIGKQESPFANLGKSNSPFGSSNKASSDIEKEEKIEVSENEENANNLAKQDDNESQEVIEKKTESTIESLTNKIKKSANMTTGPLELTPFNKPTMETAVPSPSPFSSFTNKIKETSNAFTSFSMQNNAAITLKDATPTFEADNETEENLDNSEESIGDVSGPDAVQDVSEDVTKIKQAPEISEPESEIEESVEEFEQDKSESDNKFEPKECELEDGFDAEVVGFEVKQDEKNNVLSEETDMEAIEKTESVQNTLESNEPILHQTLKHDDLPKSLEEVTDFPEVEGESPHAEDENETDESIESFENLSGVVCSDGEGICDVGVDATVNVTSKGIQVVSKTNSIEMQTETPEVDDKCIPYVTSTNAEVQTTEYSMCDFEVQTFEGSESYLAQLYKPKPLNEYYMDAVIDSMPPLSTDPVMKSMEKTYYLIESVLDVLKDNITNLDNFFMDQSTIELEKRTTETLPNLYTWRISETQRLYDIVDGLKDGYLSNGDKLEELSDEVSESTVQVLKTKNEMDELKEFIYQVSFMADTSKDNKYCRLSLHQTKMQTRLRQKMSRAYDELRSITESLNILKVYISKDSGIERDVLIEKMSEAKKHHQGVLVNIKKLQGDIEKLSLIPNKVKSKDLDECEDLEKENITSIDIVGLGMEQNTKRQLGEFFKRLNK